MTKLTILLLAGLLAVGAITSFVFFRSQPDDANDLVSERQRSTEQKQEIEAMVSQLEKDREVIAQLEEKLGSSQARIDSLQEKLDENRAEVERLQIQIAEFDAERDADGRSREELKAICSALLAEFKEQIEREEVIVSEPGDEVSITFVDKILFDFGSSSVTPKGKEVLRRAAKILKDSEEGKIRVAGHADSVPIASDYRYLFPTNWDLSAARAAAVVSYLQKEAGLDPSRMEVVGYSYYRPIASNETEEGRARNRRVEITIAPGVG